MPDDTGGQRLEVVVRDNPEEHRYEAILEETLVGIATYELSDGVMVFPHTVVPPEWEGRGVADQIVQFALDDVRARGLQALPACSFVVAWVKRHPDYIDLVPPGERQRVERRSRR
jgi:predicted GNAT family acetyltransferase